MDNEKIVNTIKQLCKNNNITVGQLEKNIGLSQGLVSKWINTTPSLDKIIDIANYFHISLDKVIGRNIYNNDDEFLAKLYELTRANSIKWSKNTLDKEKMYKFLLPDDSICSLYKADKYNIQFYVQSLYSIDYRGHYIILYVLYHKQESTNPYALSLYIYLNDTEPIIQKYKKEQLMGLWLQIIKQSGNEAPDDIRIEELKQSFLLEFKDEKHIFYNENFKDDCILLKSKTEKIIKIAKHSGYTTDAEDFYKNHKSILGEVKSAEMINARKLLLKSDKYTMQLTGVMSGEYGGGTSTNATINILRDAGFDFDESFIWNHNSFKIYKDSKKGE